MPFSDSQGKDEIREWISRIQPKTVLDIGPGAGVYSGMLRWSGSQAHLTAIEAWGPYVTKYDLTEKYDEVIVADVRYVDPIFLIGNNLVIIGDVIEHLTKSEASDILKLIVRENDFTIVSFPVLHLDQGPYEGNWFEVHQEHWSYDEFEKFCRDNGLKIMESGHGDVLAWFLLRA